MKTYDQIIKQAEDSYNRYFKEIKELPEEKDLNDVVLDTKRIYNAINHGKDHIENLHLLRQELNKKAEEAEEKAFPQEHVKVAEKVDSLYDEYIENQKRLFDLAVKVANLSHKAHH